MSPLPPSISTSILYLSGYFVNRKPTILISKIRKQVHIELVRVWHARNGTCHSCAKRYVLGRSVLGYRGLSEDWYVGKISQGLLKYCCSTFPLFWALFIVVFSSSCNRISSAVSCLQIWKLLFNSDRSWVALVMSSLSSMWASSLLWCIIAYSIALKNKNVIVNMLKNRILIIKFGGLICRLFMV